MKVSQSNDNIKFSGDELVVKSSTNIGKLDDSIKKLTFDLEGVDDSCQEEILQLFGNSTAYNYSSIAAVKFSHLNMDNQAIKNNILIILGKAKAITTFEFYNSRGVIGGEFIKSLSDSLNSVKNFIFSHNQVNSVAVHKLKELLCKENIINPTISIKIYAETESIVRMGVNKLLTVAKIPNKELELTIEGYNILLFKLANFIEETFKIKGTKITPDSSQAFKYYQKNKDFIKKILGEQNALLLKEVENEIAVNFFKFTGITKSFLPLPPELCKIIEASLGEKSLSEINFVIKPTIEKPTTTIETDLAGQGNIIVSD